MYGEQIRTDFEIKPGDFFKDKVKRKLNHEIYNNCNKKDVVEVVYDQNWGDGNDYQIVLNFKEFDWLVLLDGTYSSWDSHYWDSVSFANPYTFTETRYKATTLDEIRDKKIETILDTDKK